MIVKTPYGTSEAGRPLAFTYVPPPVVVAIETPLESSDKPQKVRIVGRALAGATAVMFGSTRAQSFTVRSSVLIEAIAPPGIDPQAEIIVITPFGSSAVVRKGQIESARRVGVIPPGSRAPTHAPESPAT